MTSSSLRIWHPVSPLSSSRVPEALVCVLLVSSLGILTPEKAILLTTMNYEAAPRLELQPAGSCRLQPRASSKAVMPPRRAIKGIQKLHDGNLHLYQLICRCVQLPKLILPSGRWHKLLAGRHHRQKAASKQCSAEFVAKMASKSYSNSYVSTYLKRPSKHVVSSPKQYPRKLGILGPTLSQEKQLCEQ